MIMVGCLVARRTLLALCLMLVFIYTPGVNEAFGTDKNEPFKFIIFAAVAGAVLLLWGEVRKLVIRTFPMSKFTSMFGW
jgi:uncharacterized membrane protein